MSFKLNQTQSLLRERVNGDERSLAALMEQNERLRLVLEGTRLGIWDWNPQTNEVSFNERWAEMLGWTLDELAQDLETWVSRVHPDDIKQCFSDIQAHIEGKLEFYENIHRMRHRDGSWRYILDRGRITERDDDGLPIRFTGTHTDITTQKEAELEAVEAAMRQRRLLASMSHEIRTPLNGIVGIIDILSTYELPDPVQKWVELVAQSSDLLQTVVDDILDFGKLDSDQMKIEHRPFDLPASLRQSVQLFAARAHRAKTQLVYSPSPDLPERVVGDRHRLQQVVMNLVSNAVKFTEGGVVSVSAVVETNLLKVEVADTGIGISDTNVIWEIYGQELPSITSKYGGTGLGLAIVKQLLANMGGSISVTSRLGEGTVFVVYLPIECAQPKVVKEEAPTVGAPVVLDDLRVLVAEDNPVNRLVVKSMLDRYGCQSVMVSTGLDAVKAALNTPFDLILMDVHMPVMDGVTATRTLRSRNCTTLIVALTADSMSENQRRCAEAGMNGFLSKPLRHEQLRRYLQLAHTAGMSASPQQSIAAG